MALSNKIREFRFKNGEITQKRLAEQVGVSRQTMNAIENGKHAPTVDVAIRIADVFGISIDDLFECRYAGKPKRRLKAPTTPAASKETGTERTIVGDQPQTSDDESVEIESGGEPAEKELEQELTFATIRRIIDS